ncbi:hypothetical protein ACFYRN_25235 [Streptomyces sp. NPDC005227]|uniref:hypothetical protein n=1 Tax=Streptomyces sp. NPDC005227 TaxID=3364707 RepID=UPI003674D12E
MTSRQWTRQGALDALRKQRRRNADDPRLEAIDGLAAMLADRLTEFTDVLPADLATVLLVAGGSVGSLAVTDNVPGFMLAEILQAAAIMLDQAAKAGES